MPQGDIKKINFSKPLEIKAYQYDIVCNGVELSSGAIRNHIPDLMYKLFAVAGYDKRSVDENRVNKSVGENKVTSVKEPDRSVLAAACSPVLNPIVNGTPSAFCK